jgi:hypothetical protein
MKRALLGMTILGVASVLAGCPIYSSSSDYRVCTSTGCYDCPDPSYSGMCIPWSCGTDSDCGSGYSCSGGYCVTAASGGGGAPTGDCSQSGCPSGFVCKLSGGTAQCASLASDDGGTPVEDATAADAPLAPDAIAPTDASATDVSPLPDAIVSSSDASSSACNAGGDCAVGSKCIDGQCAAASLLCSDATQCVVSGESCVDGVCVPHCSGGSAAVPCPTGYLCNLTLGVCNLNPAFCAGSGSSTCQGGATCVESHCVAPCTVTEAGAICPTGQVCVNGGCIPDESAKFTCKNDGQSGQLANACDTSSVCLHHDCYAACGADGGGCATGSCKNVTVSAGTYAVCGTATTLGSDCDLAVGARCSGTGVCVDGYCR